VKRSLCTRIFGFEILPAPYVVAHLQLGVLLREVGAGLTQSERCEVYLTNALTGWEPPKKPKTAILFPDLQEESERASRVKQKAPILVVLGNPPYNRFAGVAEDEEADLIEPYKTGLFEEWGVRKQLLDDLYIRFFRLAEKRIAEDGGRGIVCYISNYSWLEGLSHPVMRERLVKNFDAIWIDNCNGDKYKTGKRTPDGLPDESMFTTDDHRVGIQVGTAIATFVRRGTQRKGALEREEAAVAWYRDLWGTGNKKREMLLDSINEMNVASALYTQVQPRKSLRWVFAAGESTSVAAYESWPTLTELFPVHYSGLNENRQGALISDDPGLLTRRMTAYFDSDVRDDEILELHPGLMTDAARFNSKETRRTLLASKETFDAKNLMRLAFRPFDDQWVYWLGRTKLLNEKRVDFRQQVWDGNLFLSASQTARKGGFNQPIVVDRFGDLHLQDPWSQFFPCFIKDFGKLGGLDPNINLTILEKVCAASDAEVFANKRRDQFTDEALDVAKRIFMSALAVVWSPAYCKEHRSALLQDWPRIPIPADAAVLEVSGTLGRRIADLLLPETPVLGVTTGQLRPELRNLAVPSKTGGGNIDPDADLKIEAGWGFFGSRKAVMCGKGRVAPSPEDPKNAVDIYINESVYWANVPKDVWGMTIGGYPVVKKWLSYREFKILGRPLRFEEMTHITEVVRRIKSLLLMGDGLDANYRAIIGHVLGLKESPESCGGDVSGS
jgi:predicted helicase